MENVVPLSKTKASARDGPVPIGDAPTPCGATASDPLAALIEAAARGDQDAFARLYDLTHGKLFALCMKILRKPDRAEDALQSAYLRIWRWAHRYDPGKGSGYAWIVTVTRNVALTLAIRGGREVPSSPELDARETVSNEPDALEQAMRRQETQVLAGCLQRLPDTQRRAITLAYFEGLSHRELAERLQLPLGTAKSAIRRGMMRLRNCLEGSEQEIGVKDALAGEYVLGLLRGPARSRFARLRDQDARLCQMADRWEYALAVLVDTLPDGDVDGAVWRRIAGALPHGTQRVATEPTFWRPIALALGAAVIGLVVLQVLL
ncbi:MAG: sigma-70 family RNA polymerase sigma factor [Pseudomonadota bacterium]